MPPVFPRQHLRHIDAAVMGRERRVYTSLASVLLLAFIFGYAQQAVTRFIDRQAANIAGVET